MNENVIDLASVIVVLLAIVASAAALVTTRSRIVALPVLLDFLTAAGLLHLAAGPTLMRALTAGVVLALRRLISWSLAGERKRDDGSMMTALRRASMPGGGRAQDDRDARLGDRGRGAGQRDAGQGDGRDWLYAAFPWLPRRDDSRGPGAPGPR